MSRKDKIKRQLLDSMATNNAVEIEELIDRAEKVERPEDAANIIREHEEILREKKKGHHHSCILPRKNF